MCILLPVTMPVAKLSVLNFVNVVVKVLFSCGKLRHDRNMMKKVNVGLQNTSFGMIVYHKLQGSADKIHQCFVIDMVVYSNFLLSSSCSHPMTWECAKYETRLLNIHWLTIIR